MKGRVHLFIIFALFTFSSNIQQRRGEFRGLASSWNIIPSRSLAGLHYLFKGYELNENRGIVNVTGPVVEITEGEKWGSKVYKEGYSAEIDEDTFEEEQLLAQSIFEVTSRLGTDVGTALLVGRDLVLTNRHVLNYSTKTSRQWECGKFSIKLNHKDERVECQKVRYCSSRYDFCLVEMNKMSNGLDLGSELRSLRLTQRVKSHGDVNLTHIGNAGGLGIQASQGTGLKILGGEFFHYAPTLGGSSGAPIFNERHEVIGINWGQTWGQTMDENYNRGVLSKTIFEELLRNDRATLMKVKSFKTWAYRKEAHRNVRITTSK